MNARFVLIGDRADDRWIKLVERALVEWGPTAVVPESGLAERDWSSVRAALVDSAAVTDPVEMVRALRKAHPGVHVVVVAASPSWQFARRVLEAGASDCISRAFSEGEVRELMREVLKKPVPQDREEQGGKKDE